MALSNDYGTGKKPSESLTPYGIIFLAVLLISYLIVYLKRWNGAMFVFLIAAAAVTAVCLLDRKMDAKMRDLRQSNPKAFRAITIASKICTYIGYVLFLIGAAIVVIFTPDL